MKYLLSVWCDTTLEPIQLNLTVYADTGELLRMEVWSASSKSLAVSILEIADRLMEGGEQLRLWVSPLEPPTSGRQSL